MKKVKKKNNFVIFDLNNAKFSIGLGQISEKPVKIVYKLPYHLLVGIFMGKVKNFCDHSMFL